MTPTLRSRAARRVSSYVALALVLASSAPCRAAGLAEAIDRVKPSVVAVGTFEKLRSPAFVFRGTGFVVDDGTLVATNAHVLPDSLRVESRETMMIWASVPGSRDPQPREAIAVAVDRDHDLALLRISGPALAAVTLGDSAIVRDGLAVAFTGFPLGNALGFFPVTHRGIVAAMPPIAIPPATARQLDAPIIRRLKPGPFTLFQLDATAYPGQSGSPLYDAGSGEVLGLVNMGILKGAKDSAVGQPSGISFAVPVQYLKELIHSVQQAR